MKFKDIFAEDKVAHFGVTFALTVIISTIINSPIGPAIGMIAAVIVAIAKEIYDKVKGGRPSLADWVADFLGLVLGGICVSVLMGLVLHLS